MVEYHNKSFFGSKVGMFFDSGSWTSPHFYLKFIKKRNDKSWEKPSLREGKSIKFSLEEMVHVLRVLSKEAVSWKTVHVFEQNQTHISFNWDKEDKERFHVNGGDYHKMLNYAETVVFKALLEHVFEEKIARSTVNSTNRGSKKPGRVEPNTKKLELTVKEETIGTVRPERQNTTLVQDLAPKMDRIHTTTATRQAAPLP